MSALLAKQQLGFRLHAVCARFAGMVRQTVTANPELFLPIFLLFVWQITAIAVKVLRSRVSRHATAATPEGLFAPSRRRVPVQRETPAAVASGERRPNRETV